MMKLFNSRFEISLRVMLILQSLKQVTRNDILVLDLVATYGKKFGLLGENLHGDNQFSISEIAIRKQLIDQGIAYLRLYDLIVEIPNPKKGYLYRLTKTGSEVIEKVNDEYSVYYQNAIEKAIKELPKNNDSQLIGLLNQYRTSNSR